MSESVELDESIFVELDYSITESWDSGFNIKVEFTNNGSKFRGWQVQFDAPFEITEVRDGELIWQQGNTYKIRDVESNDNVHENETTSFSFTAKSSSLDESLSEIENWQFKQEDLDENFPSLNFSENQSSSPSSNAIVVDFENHADNTRYDRAVQSQDWEVNFSSSSMNGNAAIADEFAYQGDKSLQIKYPKGTRGGGNAAWKLTPEKEYYLSYQVRFDDNFDFNGSKYSGGKLPGLAGAGGLCGGGTECNGDNGFSSRYMWRENGRAVLYLYHMDKPQQHGEDFQLTGSNGEDKYFQPGQWHDLTQRVKLNDGYQSNGEIDIWMDGELVLSIDDLKFVTNNRGIDTLFFSTFYGGKSEDWYPDRDSTAYFDNFIVSTNASDVGVGD